MSKELFRDSRKCSIEQRINLIEKVIIRISRRVRKTVSAIITPQILSVSRFGDGIHGDVYRAILFKGKLGKAIIVFNEKPKSTICINIKVLNGKVGNTRTLYLEKAINKVDLDLDTIDGTVISMSIHSVDVDYKITNFGMSMLWTPVMSSAKIERHLIEDLMENEDEGI